VTSPEHTGTTERRRGGTLSPRTMRRLDRWIGLPLCVLASLALRLSGLVPQRTFAPPRRVLYVALAEMGSIVLAAPAIRQCARTHGVMPTFVTLAQTRGVFDFLGGEFNREVCVLRTTSLTALCADLWSFCRRMRRGGIAVAVDLDPGSRFSALVTLLSGARRRSGFEGMAQPYRGSLYTHTVDCPLGRHMSENFAALVEAPFSEIESSTTTVVDLFIPAAASTQTAESGSVLHRLRQRIPYCDPGRRRVVLIHANRSDPVPQRRWPQQRYIELCQRMLAEWPDIFVLLIGAAAEENAATALCAEIDDSRCGSVAGLFSIGELPALFALATILVSSDSGPAHFAAHAGLPVVALFGPETPQRYRPLGATVTLYAGLPCSPCLSAHNQRASSCRDPRCMQAIEVETVLGAMRDALAPAERAATA